jgi:N-acyl-D-amino-acid deacylase
MIMRLAVFISLTLVLCGCAGEPDYDVLIRGGTVYDGSGDAPFVADVAIAGDTIAAVGDLGDATAARIVEAEGRAVAPGFINMLSWATESLIEDGRSQSDIRQGVTLEVFGEGWSMGPYSEEMKQEELLSQGDIKYEITWTTLSEYLDQLVAGGISTNIASFVGATTARIHVLGYEDRAPTPAELDEMRALVREAMEEGALGLGYRAGEGRGRVRRHLHQPHAQRGQLAARSSGGADHGRGGGEHPGGDLSP